MRRRTVCHCGDQGTANLAFGAGGACDHVIRLLLLNGYQIKRSTFKKVDFRSLDGTAPRPGDAVDAPDHSVTPRARL